MVAGVAECGAACTHLRGPGSQREECQHLVHFLLVPSLGPHPQTGTSMLRIGLPFT